MARVTLLAPAGVNIERHAYCLCLHVRPATIFVALINLVSSELCMEYRLIPCPSLADWLSDLRLFDLLFHDAP